jgi:predicted dienelactone hydrolase
VAVSLLYKTSRKLFAILILILLVLLSRTASAYNSGFKELSFVTQKRVVKLACWYPTMDKEQTIYYRSWQGKAASDGSIADSIFPLVIFSHGMNGSRYNQQYLAEHLSKHGYIVAAVQHLDSNYRLSTTVQRPHDISRSITFVLNNNEFKPHLDKSKIAIVGHSLGGYTAFVASGAIVDFSKAPALYFSAINNSMIYNNFITNFFKRIYVSMKGACYSSYDKRIKAMVALAPGLGDLFDKKALARVKIPVLIIAAEKDEVLAAQHNALQYKVNLPTAPQYLQLTGAGHYSFLPLCDNTELAKTAPKICYDPERNRGELHKVIEKAVLDFLNKALVQA